MINLNYYSIINKTMSNTPTSKMMEMTIQNESYNTKKGTMYNVCDMYKPRTYYILRNKIQTHDLSISRPALAQLN